AHKDIFCTNGLRTTCASRMLADFVPPYDAAVVERLAAAGMITIGKTNMDEFAMGSSTENSWFGACRNPYDTSRVAGGSSGGSAVAVAAGIVPLATGTDTGGSVRQPAALTGTTGLKPTYGRVSRWGMIAFASSLDQAGLMAHTAEDIAMVLGAIAGFDERDSTSASEPVPDYTEALNSPVAGLRIGVPAQFFDDGLDSVVEAAVRDAIATLEQAGAKTVAVELPHLSLSVPTYYVVAPAEASSNLARYDGVRFGHRCDEPRDLDDLYRRSRSEGFGAEVQRRILIGTYVLSAGYYDAYYLRAQKVRQLISRDFAAAFEAVDVIVGPTTPAVAFGIGAKTDDPLSMYLNDIYTTAVNLAGLPGMSIPCGSHDGLPIGLQLIGPHFEEGRLLGLAHRFQQLTEWHHRQPEPTG
ncbi:MAG: Asp-tRNA(Asn)/Glu-tRNA(Gln) amidotransferase subunit GatA, partial [Gammaproteobacteria bacterium]|nr:Asp-tRNA(Asn)/Glu-tRNA(Gln) amidotransferase subunit GatA [Gammaproteobacteria bacterium]